MGAQISIIMGSQSDLEVMNEAKTLLDEFEISNEMRIISAHRDLPRLQEHVSQLNTNGCSIVIAGAGLAAHLPGVIASMTQIPVIGVPLSGGVLKGIDALMSIVQMPKGVPVATVGIDNSRNAAILAVRILALNDSVLSQKIDMFCQVQKKKVLAADQKLKSN